MRVLLAALLLCLNGVVAAAEVSRPKVLASTEPVAMLLREVLGDAVRVETLMLPNQTPHNASFTPGQARQVREADLLVWLGADAEPGMAGLLKRHAGRQLALTDLDGVYRRDGDEGHDHHHDDDAHHHGLLDPHLWLYPANMRRLAQALPAEADALGLSRDEVVQRVALFDAALTETEAAVRAALAPVAGTPYLSHHDAWAYFSDAFGVRRPLVINHNIEASASSRRFVELSSTLQAQQVHCVMAEPEARRALLERLCRDQCRLVQADPLGRDVAGGTYSGLLTHLQGLFSQCLTAP
ncbi:high-affinity zinc uptake system protein znuA [Isoalcanivorax pacificus W11-5]|uniref:High-affinity zinc uptake system protein ZnuA n=1 Tax=Isoalcanivorax pacificus W11-5 TaxID=391936 RepID=A0A0B4XNM4_9GAMM|nr:metal ABC transporter substrate-binding protein [Isoalcanivorax pacificus]AJD49944.1 high-affinity zinc uptake system protein znuA [Isoalcanivorax pacificus W11-5]